MSPLKIFFDVQQLYYLPQYLPVYEELTRRGISCQFVLHDQEQISGQLKGLKDTGKWPVAILKSSEVHEFYLKESPDWVIFGNHSPFQDKLPTKTRTALLYHGIGIKECYYESRLAQMSVRFVEGPYRLRELQRRFPASTFVDVGFPKLDPLFKNEERPRTNNKRPTILYAPTFYPSSIELMPKNWPALFLDCDILIKPHFFSMTVKNYQKQRHLLESWAKQYPNVTLASIQDFSLVPYMERSDVLISEASSALFEFAALDRPVIWLDFYKLRWTYRGPLRFRHTRRMDNTILQYADIAEHVKYPPDLEKNVRQELNNPNRLSDKRRAYTELLIGKTDGRVSNRIADYLLFIA